MKHVFAKLIKTSVVLGMMQLSLASWAAETAVPPGKAVEDKAIADNTATTEGDWQFKGFMLQHKIRDNSLPSQSLDADPMALYRQLIADIKQQVNMQKPTALTSTVKLVLEPPFDKLFNNIPMLTINTKVDETGKGQSEFVSPTYKHTFTGDGNKILFDWKGVKGLVDFDEQFKHFTLNSEFAGLQITEGDEKLDLADKTQINATLDDLLLPKTLKVHLPKLHVSDKKEQLNVSNFLLETTLEQLSNNLELTNIAFSVSEFTTTSTKEGDVQFSDIQLKTHVDADADNKHFDYGILLKVGEFLLPEMLTETKQPMSYSTEFKLHNLDNDAIANITNTLHDMLRQQMMGNDMSAMASLILFGKAMEVLPKLIAQSPAISLNDLKLVTPEGTLNGQLKVSLQGDKATNWQNIPLLINALNANADFEINKALLKKIIAVSNQIETGQDVAASNSFAEQAINAYLAQQFLVEKADKYILQATMAEGNLMVNGQAMPLPF